MTFELWKFKLDMWMIDQCGLDSDDFEDYLWFDCFKAGESPEQAGKEFLEEKLGEQ